MRPARKRGPALSINQYNHASHTTASTKRRIGISPLTMASTSNSFSVLNPDTNLSDAESAMSVDKISKRTKKNANVQKASIQKPPPLNIVGALIEHGRIISEYMKKWKINLNADKTQAIFITNRRKKELPGKRLKIFDSSIPWQTECKYLGFMLEKRMTFKKHVEYVIDRANVAVHTLYPLISRKSKLHLKNKITIYKLAIRPIMTYACPAFINIGKCHLEKIQKFQNRILRMILNLNRFTRIKHLHEVASVPLIKDYIAKLTAKFQQQQ